MFYRSIKKIHENNKRPLLIFVVTFAGKELYNITVFFINKTILFINTTRIAIRAIFQFFTFMKIYETFCINIINDFIDFLRDFRIVFQPKRVIS